MLESQKGTFFESGDTDPNGNGRELLMTIAEELGKIPNKINIEGHTDSQQFSGRANYTNWELSADRANASRRLMQQHGLRENQVAQVRGFADQEPREGMDAADPSNRRITLIVKYVEGKGVPGKDAGGSGRGSEASGYHSIRCSVSTNTWPRNCHPERSGDARRRSAVEGPAVPPRRIHCGRPQILRLRRATDARLRSG